MPNLDQREIITARLRECISPNIATQSLEIVVWEVVRLLIKEPRAIGVVVRPYLFSEEGIHWRMEDLVESLYSLYKARGIRYISIGDTTTDLLDLMKMRGMTVVLQEEIDLT